MVARLGSPRGLPVRVESASVSERGTVLVIGNFDGVHRGHQALLAAARERGDRVVAVTFEPHPMTVIRPDLAPKLLTAPAERDALLRRHGADDVISVGFDEAVAHWSPAEFVDRVLRPQEPSLVIVGENFRFGHRAAGSVADIEAAGIPVAPLSLLQVGRAPVSSTAVRAALARGDVDTAAEQLGRPFTYCGTVVKGDQRGRELGFPTANLAVPADRMVPSDGVYAGWLTAGADRWAAAISVGTNPTFAGTEHRVESYVLDRDDLELYGVHVCVEFAARLRGMVTFDGLDGLVAQMREDVRQARNVLRLG